LISSCGKAAKALEQIGTRPGACGEQLSKGIESVALQYGTDAYGVLIWLLRN
jgi:hypothetical protein